MKVEGQRIRDIRFADDQAMLANTKEEQQELMDRLNETSNKYNEIKCRKDKTMCVSRCRKQINLTIAEQVGGFLYLGAVITEDGQTIEDTKTRIALAKKKFLEKKELLSADLDLETRKKLIKLLSGAWPLMGQKHG